MSALKTYRKSKGWTLAVLGGKLGVIAGAVSNYERGTRAPQPTKREFIAKFTRGAVPVSSWEDVQ